MKTHTLVLLLQTLVILEGCSSGHEEILGPHGRAVEYSERTSEGYETTTVYPDDDCSLHRTKGPSHQNITRGDFHCSKEELETVERLLSAEAWAGYVGIVSHGLGGAGGERGTDWSDTGPLMPTEAPIGYVRVDRTGWDSGTLDIKAFWADSDGPEAALIAYFQALNKKYVPKE